MNIIKPSEYNQISGGDHITTAAAVVGGVLGAMYRGNQYVGDFVVFSLGTAALTAWVVRPAYNSGILMDYATGDLCSVAKKLWPFERKSARRFLKN